MGKRTILISACAAMAALLVAPHAVASRGPAERTPARIDEAEDCLEPVPARTSLYGIQDDGAEVVLDVHFVLDDLHLEWGRRMVDFAAEPFADIGIRVDATFEEIHFEPTGELDDGTPTIAPLQLIEETRAHLGGYRPHGADVVYTFTAKELVSPGAFGGSVAGQADCIGGVRYPEAAFAVGETGLEDREDWNKYSGKIAAHEIAHLLGAHHHYANCAEADSEGLREDLTPCTLMFNDVFFISLRMSTAEGAAVRGHALAYANDTPEGPPPPAEREVWLERTSRGLRGGVASPKTGCAVHVEVDVQHQRRKTIWETVATITTGRDGWFRYRPKAPGRLRAVARPKEAYDRDSWWGCPEVVSDTVDF